MVSQRGAEGQLGFPAPRTLNRATDQPTCDLGDYPLASTELPTRLPSFTAFTLLR
jgi:hypothetical protein